MRSLMARRPQIGAALALTTRLADAILNVKRFATTYERSSRMPETLSADWIRALRERLMLDQTEFANRVGASHGSVSLWERGIRTPRMKFRRAMVALSAETGPVESAQ